MTLKMPLAGLETNSAAGDAGGIHRVWGVLTLKRFSGLACAVAFFHGFVLRNLAFFGVLLTGVSMTESIKWLSCLSV